IGGEDRHRATGNFCGERERLKLAASMGSIRERPGRLVALENRAEDGSKRAGRGTKRGWQPGNFRLGVSGRHAYSPTPNRCGQRLVGLVHARLSDATI